MRDELLTKARLTALARFGVGGLLSSGVAVSVTAALHEFGFLTERAAAAVGLATALIVNFLVLRYFVVRGTHLPLVRQQLLFLGSSGAFRGLEYLGFLLVNTLFRMHYLLALVLVLGVSFILKFVVYEGWVFARARQLELDDRAKPRDAP